MTAPVQPVPSNPLTPTQKMRANLEAMRAQGATAEEQAQEIERWKPKIQAFNQKEMAGAGSVANLAVKGFTSNFSDEIAGAADAVGAMVPGGKSPGEAYTATRDAIRMTNDAYAAENPKTALAAELGGALLGGVGTGLSAARVAPGVLGAGLKAAKIVPATTRLGRLGQGVAIGAGSGAVAGAGGAEEGNRLRGAGTGAAFGAAAAGTLGAAGTAIGAGARRLGLGPRAASGPVGGAQRAAGDVLGTMDADQAAAARVSDVLDAGKKKVEDVLAPNAPLDPTSVLADVDVGGQKAMRLLGTAKRLGEEAPEMVESRLGGRARNRPRKISGDLARVSGVARFNPLDEADRYVDEARTAARPLYDEVAKFAAVADDRIAEAVDLIPEDRMAALWKGVRDIARGEGRKLSKALVDPETGKLAFDLEPREMDYLKRALDEVIYSGGRQAKMGQPGGLTNAETRLLQQARDLIVRSAEDATGGPGGVYAQARAVFDGPVSLKRAMEEGLDAPRMAQAEVERATRTLSPRQREAFSRGGVEAFRNKLADTPPGRTNIARNLQDDTSREQLRSILGGSATEFENVLAGETAREATEQGVLRGSQTAERLADDADLMATALPMPTRQGLVNAAWSKVAAPFERLARGQTKAESDAVARILSENIGDAKSRAKILKLLQDGKTARAKMAYQAAIRRGAVASSVAPEDR